MTPKERLDAVQNKLIERGVIDIKFAFSENIADHSLDTVRLMISRVLEAYSVGEYKPLPPLNDRNLNE